jgi:hypothetical protein
MKIEVKDIDHVLPPIELSFKIYTAEDFKTLRQFFTTIQKDSLVSSPNHELATEILDSLKLKVKI